MINSKSVKPNNSNKSVSAAESQLSTKTKKVPAAKSKSVLSKPNPKKTLVKSDKNQKLTKLNKNKLTNTSNISDNAQIRPKYQHKLVIENEQTTKPKSITKPTNTKSKKPVKLNKQVKPVNKQSTIPPTKPINKFIQKSAKPSNSPTTSDKSAQLTSELISEQNLQSAHQSSQALRAKPIASNKSVTITQVRNINPRTNEEIKNAIILRKIVNENRKKFNRRKIFYKVLPFLVYFMFIILLQVFYPKNITLPFTNVLNHDFSMQNTEKVTADIHNFESQTKITVINDSDSEVEEMEFTLEELGAKVNVNAIIDNVNSYSKIDRLLPFSMFKNGLLTLNQPVLSFLDSSNKLDEIQPVDAVLNEQEDVTQAEIIPSRNGIQYDKSELNNSLSTLNLDYSQNNYTIHLNIHDVFPNFTTEDAQIQHIENVKTKSWEGFRDQLIANYQNRSGFSMVVIDLSNKHRDLSINADKMLPSASVYKLYAAYSMYKNGNPPSCIRIMITKSDNGCPENYMSSYGWDRMCFDAAQIGLSVQTGNDFIETTTHSVTNFLMKLYNKSLNILPEQQSELLELMKIQQFRLGIPNGVNNASQSKVDSAVVADKVGFLPDILPDNGIFNDAGIVYNSKGNYIEVIFTQGMNWSEISKIAERVHHFYN